MNKTLLKPLLAYTVGGLTLGASPTAFSYSSGSLAIGQTNCTICHGSASSNPFYVTPDRSTVEIGEIVPIYIGTNTSNNVNGFRLEATGGFFSGENSQGNITSHSSPQTSFVVNWTAPSSPGNIDFSFCGNKANGDGFSNIDQGATLNPADESFCGPVTSIVVANAPPPNRPPEIAAHDTITMTVDLSQGGPSVSREFSASDPDGDTLSWEVPPHTSKGQLAGNPFGSPITLTYTVNDTSKNDQDRFNLTVSDGTLTDTITVIVDIIGAQTNSAPQISTISSQTVTSGQSIDIALNATDDDSSSLSWEIEQQPSQGSVSFTDSNGAQASVRFNAPTVAQTQTVNFKVRTRDSQGETDSENVSVTVQPVPVTPVAPVINTAADQTIPSGESTTFNLSASDGNAGDTLSWSILTSSPLYGAVSPQSGSGNNFSFTYTANAVSILSTDGITVEVEDSTGLTSETTILVNVIPDIGSASTLQFDYPTLVPTDSSYEYQGFVLDLGTFAPGESMTFPNLNVSSTATPIAYGIYDGLRIDDFASLPRGEFNEPGSTALMDFDDIEYTGNPLPIYTAPQTVGSDDFVLGFYDSAGDFQYVNVLVDVQETPATPQGESNGGGGGSLSLLTLLLGFPLSMLARRKTRSFSRPVHCKG